MLDNPDFNRKNGVIYKSKPMMPNLRFEEINISKNYIMDIVNAIGPRNNN
jgi:hypothetical protein